MMHKSTKIIAVGGLIIFMCSLAIFVTFFLMVEDRKEAYANQTIELAKAEDYHRGLSALMRTLEETKAERTSLVSRVLTEEEVIDFLALIETLGREQGAVLTTSSLLVEPIDPVFETLVVNVEVRGGYDEVIRSLTTLEYLPYQSSIKDFRMTREESTEGVETWKSTYQVRVTKFKKT